MTSIYGDADVMAPVQLAFDAAMEYWRDAWQRSVLTLEALNERGNIHLAQAAKDVLATIASVKSKSAPWKNASMKSRRTPRVLLTACAGSLIYNAGRGVCRSK